MEICWINAQMISTKQLSLTSPLIFSLMSLFFALSDQPKFCIFISSLTVPTACPTFSQPNPTLSSPVEVK